MAQRIAILPPLWDLEGLPRSIGWLQYKERCFAFAKKLTGHTHANGQGLAPRLLSQAAFQAKFGAPPALHDDPGPYPAGGDGAAIADHKELKDLFAFQRSMEPVLESGVEGGYPPDVRAMMEENFSLDHLTLEDQFVELDNHLPILAADVKWLHTNISSRWPRKETIEAFTARQLQYLTYLAMANQAPAALQAVDWMWKAFTSTPQDEADFASCRTRFLDRHPALADQTPVRFAAAVVSFVNTLLHAERAANVARRQANAATEVVAGDAGEEPDQLGVLMALYARDPAAASALYNRRTTAALAAPAPAAAAPIAAPRKKHPPYCHTCGVHRITARQHHSKDCRTKAPGHRNEATFTNQLGGRPAY